MRILILLGLSLAAAGSGGGATLSDERAPPDGLWRPHRLARCPEHPRPRGEAESAFDEARRLFDLGNGGDAAVVLELAIDAHAGHPWLLLLLAQIYLLAGQGEVHCQPAAGPLAPTGDWERDRRRLLGRAGDLLERLERSWSDDGLVDFLRADVARALDDQAAAAEHDFRGRGKCTHLESLDLLQAMRGLLQRPADVAAPIVPIYPEAAARRRIQGEVILDLLVDPFGRAVAARQVGRADPLLAEAALLAAPDGGFQAARVGYYPVWSWLRVPIRFRLEN